MKYFIDMTVGVIVGFLPMFIIECFCDAEGYIWTWVFVLGVVLPCLILGVYSILRYALTNEKAVARTCVIGCIVGEFLADLTIDFLYAYVPDLSILHMVEYGEGFNAIGKYIFSGLCMIGTIVIAPIITFLFLFYILKDRRSNRDVKKMQKGEAAGLALYSPPAGYCFIASAVPKFCKSMVSYKEAENSPIVVGFAWAGSLLICLVAAVLIYIVVKGRNIPYVLAAYIAEAALFLLCIKRFQLSFPYIPLAALGGVLIMGAGIYKGLEKLFAFVNARVEQEISESEVEKRDKIQDYIHGILVTAGLAIAVSRISQTLFELAVSMLPESFFNNGKSPEILLLSMIGAIMIPFIIKMYKMLKGKYYVFVPTCYGICFTLFIVCQSNSLLEGKSIYGWKFGVMTGISFLLSTILMSLKK